ncbi:MAG: hypothetical protein AAF483_04440 [Planctomycetota bacterium]
MHSPFTPRICTRSIYALVLLNFLLTPALAQKKAEQLVPNEYYPYFVGTTWVYSGEGQEVTVTISDHAVVEGKRCAVMESAVGGNTMFVEHMHAAKDGVYRLKMANETISPAWKILQFPIKEGVSWDCKSEMEGVTAVAKNKLSKAKVKVAAGTFDTIQVTSDVEMKDAKGATVHKMVLTSYMAKGVGMVKQVRESTGEKTVLELKQFKKAGK